MPFPGTATFTVYTSGKTLPRPYSLVPPGSVAEREAAVLVETSASWPPVWTPRPEIECLHAAKFIGPNVGSATFSRRYGAELKDPTDAEPVTRAPLRLAGHWCQIKLLGRGPAQCIWAGRITDEQDLPHGSANPTLTPPAGVQTYSAYGPLRVLERMNFASSWWVENNVVKEIGWLPGFNFQPRGPSGAALQRGNRSAAVVTPSGHGASFLFGGNALWDSYSALSYLVEQHVNPQLAGPDPFLVVAGQILALAEIEDYVPMRGGAENVADLLVRLVPEKYGLSFKFNERVDSHGNFYGWELQVVSLLAEAVTLGTLSLPSEIVMTLPLLTDRKFNLVVERSTGQRYRTVRAVGERVISCFSLGPNSADAQPLTAGWTAAAEAAYIAAGDQDRQDDAYRDVYQVFRARTDYGFQGGAANPLIRPLTGAGNTMPVWVGVTTPAYQLAVRETLARLPLLEQHDYTVSPPKLIAGTAGVADPYDIDFLPPVVFAQAVAQVGTPAVATPVRLQVDRLGLIDGNQANASVSVLERGLGLRVRSQPNHAYALASAASFAGSNFIPTSDNAVDWTNCDMTIACELDQRIVVEHVAEIRSPADVENDGGVLQIEVPDAHFWWLAPNTIVGVGTGTTYRKSPATGTIIRDDRYKLLFALGGAIARHQRDRFAAQVEIRELSDYGKVLGYFVAAQYRQGLALTEKAQITAVHWDFSRMTTQLGLG